MKCFAYSGIEAIRKALQAGEALSTEEVSIKVRLVAPPLYVMSTTSTDKVAAIEMMERAVDAIGEKIGEEKGELVIKMKVGSKPPDCIGLKLIGLQPKVVSETDDAELKKLMEQFEAANMDVAGDDDSDVEDDGVA